MSQVGYDLWYFDDTAEYGESVASSGVVLPLPSDVILYKSVYVAPYLATTEGLAQARQLMQTLGNLYILRPVHSSDGPPFRSALIYRFTPGEQDILRAGDMRLPQSVRPSTYKTRGFFLHAVRSGSLYAWETDAAQGTPGFFLTGSSGLTELWRVARVERDALDRQVITLAPVRLAHGVIAPDFSAVADLTLRQHLEQHFTAFQQAVSGGAHFDMINRASNLAEGVLAHCLTVAGVQVPSTLHARLAEVRKVLDAKGAIPLTAYGHALAEKIRHLHKQLHADQAVARGQTVRPEVGMTLTADVSELLRDAGLGRY
jgi:hypothetical protein